MRHIAILGGGDPSNRRANELPPGIELWGMNLCHRGLTRPAQRWFQMHHRMHGSENGNPPGHFGRPLDHERFLQTCGIPVMMQSHDPLIPTAMRYPRLEVAARFGDYFTSTVAFALGLALYEGAGRITLLGIFLQTAQEYGEQRECMAYWLGVARTIGVPVDMPEDLCTLTKGPVYAYDEADRLGGLRLTKVEALAV